MSLTEDKYCKNLDVQYRATHWAIIYDKVLKQQ